MTDRCATCGGPRHPRLVVRQAVHVPPARPWTPVRLWGHVIFVLGLFAAVIYSLLIAGSAVSA